jgi:four helix bundle protein
VSKRGFEGLEVWQKARQLMVAVHKQVVPLLPPEEKWGLASQIRRSSKSVMANIAEGYGRYYYQDNVRLCYIARGSLDETISHLITALDLDYIPNTLYDDLRALADETRRLLNGYINFLKRRKQGENEPGSHISAREIPEDHVLENSDASDAAQ